ncbi:MAG: acyltransferase domain-containing protein [Burkholderiaceae bacterium]|uniref:ACP S-malonyltransferase n=1 Tax=Herminiimonas sp. Marseille-P9896 TaxID=2742211 RepID=UPI00158D73AF|nr:MULTISPECIES: acyltransferase domain-containing protein [Oxalobacteraceae]MBX9798014.1 acyltransferase domain-containing protein [Burkholderiaceae bacterium]
MMNRVAILCSGQAGQHAGMFDLAREDVRVAQLLQAWPLEDLCRHPLQEILADEKLLFANPIAQPLVVASILATWEAVKNIIPKPVVVAGYSIGELASWAVAGALSAEEAIRLAALRANLLQGCIAADQPQVMLAISLSQSLVQMSEIQPLLDAHGFYMAIEVADDAVIAGGLLKQVDGLEAAISNAGGKVTRLPIEIASHTPWMQAAVQAFETAIASSGIKAPLFPVLAGISGARLLDKNAAAGNLSRQLAEPIRWQAVMDSLEEAGVTMALELGPGAALARMLKTRHPHIQCRSVAEFRSLSGIRKWVEQYADA